MARFLQLTAKGGKRAVYVNFENVTHFREVGSATAISFNASDAANEITIVVQETPEEILDRLG